ncbi:MAG TPA: hypothetical protein VEF04_21105 [Blastocatellia bacterium]|nr:hypothetical protein [Blastocatellia bacterium]
MVNTQLRKLCYSLYSQAVRVYVSDYGSVRIETDHYRCEMPPETFLELLRKAIQQHPN